MKSFSLFGIMALLLLVAALLIVPSAFAAPITMLGGSPVLTVLDLVAPGVAAVGYSMQQVACAECLNFKGTSGLATATTRYEMKNGATLAQGFPVVISSVGIPAVFSSKL